VNTDDMTPEQERADYLKTVCERNGITAFPARDHLRVGVSWCARAVRDGKEYHACGDGSDAYEAVGNLLETLATRPR
jgi:hypothetical protein